jgi:hypothetical protein
VVYEGIEPLNRHGLGLVAASEDRLEAQVLKEILDATVDELRSFVRADCAWLAVHGEDVPEHRR